MIARGDVRWAQLADPDGTGPGFRRPVLVIQADAFNRSRIATVMVAAMSGNLDLAAAPGNVRVDALDSGLPRDSVVNVSQILTLDRQFLGPRTGGLPARLLEAVDAGLILALGLARVPGRDGRGRAARR